jgi:hypothetical protein
VGRENVSPEDYKAVAKGVYSAFGTWSVDEATKTITFHFEGSLFPNTIGAELKRTIVSVTADEMKTASITGTDNAVWRRFIKPCSSIRQTALQNLPSTRWRFGERACQAAEEASSRKLNAPCRRLDGRSHGADGGDRGIG